MLTAYSATRAARLAYTAPMLALLMVAVGLSVVVYQSRNDRTVRRMVRSLLTRKGLASFARQASRDLDRAIFGR